jgi:glycosyltransferase involved in cell wall biosynthesis
LVEAIAHGKAIVTTSVGAQGVEFLTGQAFLVADSPEQFARAILEISTSDERRLALQRGAHDAAIDVFSPYNCYQPLVAELNGARGAQPTATSRDEGRQ